MYLNASKHDMLLGSSTVDESCTFLTTRLVGSLRSVKTRGGGNNVQRSSSLADFEGAGLCCMVTFFITGEFLPKSTTKAASQKQKMEPSSFRVSGLSCRYRQEQE